MKKLFGLILLIVFIAGCIEKAPETEKDRAVAACIQKCKDALAVGQDLSDGPCLSDEIIANWVCDAAHSPREAVDNQPENQCSAYRAGTATHFVEVDPSCNFIRAI